MKGGLAKTTDTALLYTERLMTTRTLVDNVVEPVLYNDLTGLLACPRKEVFEGVNENQSRSVTPWRSLEDDSIFAVDFMVSSTS